MAKMGGGADAAERGGGVVAKMGGGVVAKGGGDVDVVEGGGVALPLMPASGRLVQAVLRQQCSSSRDILPLSAVSCKHACTYTYIYVEILFIMHALALKSILNNFPYIFTYFTIEDKAYNRNKL